MRTFGKTILTWQILWIPDFEGYTSQYVSGSYAFVIMYEYDLRYYEIILF